MNQAIEHAMATAIRSVEEGRLLMEEISSQLERRDEHEAAARLRESSRRARHKVNVMNELIRESDPVPMVED
jgi:hypothetical protein